MIHSDIIKAVLNFRDNREWKQFHNPKDLAISISLEAAELLEIFQWSGTDVFVKEKSAGIAEELADVLIYCILMSDAMNLDMNEIVIDKLEKNEKKYCVDKSFENAIKEAAKRYDSKIIEVELQAQFRCAGAEGFLNWIDHNFQIRETANFDGWDDGAFEFEILEDPHLLANRITEKNAAGFKARLLAGFAWPWTGENEGNADAEIADVQIPEFGFQMPWNSRHDQYSWAIDQTRVNQIGCVHTSQGLEFDYVGVIVGNDLRYNPLTNLVYSSYSDYYDSSGKKGLKDNPKELNRLIKNIYKVLLSRGMKGCFVYCRDKNLQDYLKSRLRGMNQTIKYPFISEDFSNMARVAEDREMYSKN
jgi:DUF2075 family protein/NTP pyrophosphatase (non-canonical NTP hydrolase)